MRTNKIKNEINDIKKWESKINQKDLKCETKNSLHDFQQYDTIRSFGDNICSAKISTDEAEMDQTNLLKIWKEFSKRFRPRIKRDRDKKKYF